MDMLLFYKDLIEDPKQLVWNIEELFQPKGKLSKLDDGEGPPVLVQIDRFDLSAVRGQVKMGTVDVNILGGEVNNGFFEIDITTKM